MQVFLIPVSARDYEPYFEPDDSAHVEDHGAGWLSRMRRKLAAMLHEAEAERHRRHDQVSPDDVGLLARLRRTSMRWIVERAAEQRLLWHLRNATDVTLVSPNDLAAADALATLRTGLKRDSDRHRLWFVVNLVGLVLSIATILIPGPNVLGYYFTFTTVGHLLAWRGAQQGLRRVAWRVEGSEHLTDLRSALALASPEREHHVQQVADRLGLRHLKTFVARLAATTA